MTWNRIIGYIIAAFIGVILAKVWDFFTIKRVRNSVLRWLAFFFHTRTLKTKSIKSNIETYLNQEIKVANTRAFGSNILIDEKVKVEWVRLEEEETILTEEGEVIIRLGYNMDENNLKILHFPFICPLVCFNLSYIILREFHNCLIFI